MINIQNLNFSYSPRKALFNDANFEIPLGKIYGLLGKNGAGKSSLIHLISSIYLPKSGDCLVMGHNTKKRNPNMLKNIIVVPEVFQMPSIPIQNFLNMNALFYPKLDKELFFRCLTEIGLNIEDKKLKMNRFSYGQSKKIMICFAIATNCQIIIMDEPTNGLDIPSKKNFRQIVLKHIAQKKRTLIISTHLIKDIEEIIDSVIFIDNGKKIFHRDVEEINNKISFVESQKEPKSFIYLEQTKQGFCYLKEKKSEKTSKTNSEQNLNLELLFNGVLEKNQEINKIF